MVEGWKRGAGSVGGGDGTGGRCCRVLSMTLAISISCLSPPVSLIKIVEAEGGTPMGGIACRQDYNALPLDRGDRGRRLPNAPTRMGWCVEQRSLSVSVILSVEKIKRPPPYSDQCGSEGVQLGEGLISVRVGLGSGLAKSGGQHKFAPCKARPAQNRSLPSASQQNNYLIVGLRM